MPVNTGACLSPKDELAQEYLRIRHVHRIEIARVNYSQAVVDSSSVLSVYFEVLISSSGIVEATLVFAGMDFVTKVFPATTEFAPIMVSPPRMVVFA